MSSFTENIDSVRTLIETQISCQKLVIIDDGSVQADNLKLNVLIVSEQFHEVGLLDRQRMVHAAVKSRADIHALSMRTYTVEEYEKRKATLIAAFQ